jgi:hypothetical protein
MITFANNGITTSILDYDAREFIRLAKLTDETQIRAVNDLCKDLKKEGFWNSLNRCYPFVYAGTTASMLVCLKTRNSLILTTTPNGITFSSTGVQFGYTSSLTNNTSFMAGTGDIFYGGHLSIYNRTNTSLSLTNQFHGGNGNYGANLPGTQRRTGVIIGFGTASNGVGTIRGSLYNGSTYNVPGSPVNSTNTDGYNINPRFNTFTYSGSNTGLLVYSTINIYDGTASMTNPWMFYMSKNESILGMTWSVKNFPAAHTPILGNYRDYSSLPGISNQSLQEICWWSWGAGDSTTSNGGPIELSKQPSFYKIIQKFQTSLGRQV